MHQKSVKKRRSRLHAYVDILAAADGINISELIANICDDMRFIMRLQKHYKPVFSCWSPSLNLQPRKLDLFKLEKWEASLVLENCQLVYRIVTEALRSNAMPPGHLCHTMNGAIVQWRRLDAALPLLGAAAGELVWYVMCARCKQELASDVARKQLEKVDILKPNSLYVRMLDIKQAGKLQVFSYLPEGRSRDDGPCDPAACEECQRMCGVVASYKVMPRGAHKPQAARAVGGRADSFQYTFQQQCSETFGTDSQDAAVPVHEPFETEDLPTSEDEEEAGMHTGLFVTMDDSGREEPLDLNEFFCMDGVLDAQVLELLNDDQHECDERGTLPSLQSGRSNTRLDDMYLFACSDLCCLVGLFVWRDICQCHVCMRMFWRLLSG